MYFRGDFMLTFEVNDDYRETLTDFLDKFGPEVKIHGNSN